MVRPFLEARAISKRFGGVQALSDVSLHVATGEVVAVVGENGAGKSTLMKILAGVLSPDSGSLIFDDQPVHLSSVRDALKRGVALIHQELNLAENLSVAANIFLGRELVVGQGGLLSWLAINQNNRMRQRSKVLLEKVGLTVSPDVIVGDLPPGQRQLVEIARALSLDARLIIMDEPTSSLTQRETDRLYEVIVALKTSGVAVLYISHRLMEVQRVADRVCVLRDGRNSGDLERSAISHDSLIRLMVGRDLKQLYPRHHKAASDVSVKALKAFRLEVRNLTYEGGPRQGISLHLRAGEIVGMAGLVGAGRTELAEALFGLRRVLTGEVLLDGQPVRFHHPSQAVEAGLFLIPEDRRRHGLILVDNIRRNLSLPNLRQFSRFSWVIPRLEAELTQQMIDRLRIKAAGPGQIVGELSGGNQQKVVVGKWLAQEPRVLLFDEPTRGVDVGARSEIYALLDELAGQGVAILMISSDLEEILGMSDRVLVLHQGLVTGELSREALSEEAVMRLATGGSLGSQGNQKPDAVVTAQDRSSRSSRSSEMSDPEDITIKMWRPLSG